MSTFYPQNDYRGYLSHHGIKGQKWGEQNGPPYPLSTKMHNMVVKGRQKRAEKRRQKILHDPKKLTKHATEFSKEEIDEAIAKIDSINQAKKRIKPTKGEIRREEKRMAKEESKLKAIRAKEEKKAEKKLTKKMEKYGSDPISLEANASKFTPTELKAALERVQTKNKVFDAKIDSLNKPKKMLDLGIGYIDSALNLIDRIKKIRSLLPTDSKVVTEDEKHNDYIFKLIKSGKLSEGALLSNTKAFTAYTTSEMAKKKQKESEEESAYNRRQQAEQRIYDRRQQEEQRIYDRRQAESKERYERKTARERAANEQANIVRQQDLDHQVRMAQVDAGKLGDNVTKVILTSTNDIPEGYSNILLDKYGSPLKLSGMDEILSVSFSDIDKDYFLK